MMVASQDGSKLPWDHRLGNTWVKDVTPLTALLPAEHPVTGGVSLQASHQCTFCLLLKVTEMSETAPAPG